MLLSGDCEEADEAQPRSGTKLGSRQKLLAFQPLFPKEEFWFNSYSCGQDLPIFTHRLHGRNSEHFVLVPLQAAHATEILFLFAVCRAF